jgi:hypothetical protein
MFKGIPKNAILGAVFSVLTVFSSAMSANAQTLPKGNIIGFIYAKDGTTPLEGAVVKFKSIATGKIYDSTRSDDYGIFKVRGVESGFYTYGVVTEGGDFNADNIIGLKVDEKETAKLSIALDPYDQDTAAAVSEVIQGQEKNGEFLAGMVAGFDPASRTARIEVVKGLLRLNDRIHTKGKTTDFYQEISVLKVGSSPARQAIAGQTAALKMQQSAQQGDLVYVVQDNKIFPFFLAPLGVAVVIAANSAVTHGVVTIRDEAAPVSPKR